MAVKHCSDTSGALEGEGSAGESWHSRLSKQSCTEDTGKHYTQGERSLYSSYKEFYGRQEGFHASKGRS